MRDLVVTTFVTLDGVMQAPGGPEEDTSGGFSRGGWLVPFFDEDMGAQMDAWFASAEDFLLGRGTYEIFAAHWPQAPTEDDAVAAALNTKTKHVASRTLSGPLGWATAQVIEGDVPAAVRALRAADGGELQVHGSAGLVQTLLREDLVDVLRVIVFPVSVGEGKRLFGEGASPRTWQLTSSKASSTGALMCEYRRVGDLQTGAIGAQHED